VGCEAILDYIPHGLSKAYQYYCFEQSSLGNAWSKACIRLGVVRSTRE
jgi:hypothetical protein